MHKLLPRAIQIIKHDVVLYAQFQPYTVFIETVKDDNNNKKKMKNCINEHYKVICYCLDVQQVVVVKEGSA